MSRKKNHSVRDNSALQKLKAGHDALDYDENDGWEMTGL